MGIVWSKDFYDAILDVGKQLSSAESIRILNNLLDICLGLGSLSSSFSGSFNIVYDYFLGM